MTYPILFVTALGWEAAAVARAAGARLAGPAVWRTADPARPLCVLRTGIGARRAVAAVEAAAVSLAPRTIVVTGCAGALGEGLRTGDLVVGSEVGDGRFEGRSSPVWVARYEAAASRAGIRCRSGRLFTSDVVLANVEEKRRAAEHHGAIAVEMETAAIAQWSTAAGLDFAAARIVLDTVETAVPLLPLDPNGRPRPLPLLSSLLRKPALFPELVRLGRALRHCRAALSSVHRALFATQSSW